MRIDRNIRVLGIDDSPKGSGGKVLVAGVVCRGGIIEGVLSTHTSFDGDDGTRKTIAMLERSRFAEQVKAVMLNSVMLGGLNVVDIGKVSERLGVPVIAATRRLPRMEKVKKAISHVKNGRSKLRRLAAAGESAAFDVNGTTRFAQFAGASKEEVQGIFDAVGLEPVRLAHIIASGIVTGESKGRL
ncbi:Uncharacterised protein [uncultured archaeon]|nr:Uncharacterised protein [uncultured archaeon]